MEDRKLVIKFYDNIQRNKTFEERMQYFKIINELENEKESTLSVNYSGFNSSLDIICKDFISYWKKIIYSLGEFSDFGYALERDISELIKNGIKKNCDIISQHRIDIKIKIVNEIRKFNKIYDVKFQTIENIPFSKVYLKCSWGGENTYAPLTVFIFLNHIVTNLTDDELKIFNNNIKSYTEKD